MRINYLKIFYFLAILAGLLIALMPILFGLFPFTFDQARDIIWVKNQVDFFRPYLIGPWGSLAGVYFGPLWYWLLTIPFVIFSGNPVGVTLFNATLVFGSILLAAWLFKKHLPKTAIFIILLGFWSPAVHGIASFAFSQHLLMLLTLLFIYSLTQVLLNSSQKHFILSFLWASLMFHAEPPISIFSLPTIFVVAYFSGSLKKFFKLKIVLMSLLIFVLPFLPQIIFEIRHNFIQLRSIVSYFQGNNKSLGDILPFYKRILDRSYKFFEVFRLTVFQKSKIVSLLLVLLVFFYRKILTKNKFGKAFLKTSFIYLVNLMIIFILYPPQLKEFYLDGIIIIFLVIEAMLLTFFWKKKKIKKFVIAFLVIVFIQNMSPYYFINSLKNGFRDKHYAGSIFSNQKQAVDWIYHDAKGRGFKVYSYVPAIYDYPYQYLFLWYGLEKYGYLPEEFAYLPSQPNYVEKKPDQLSRLSDKIKPADNLIYLIISKDDYSQRAKNWLNQFSQDIYSLDEIYWIYDTIRVEKRQLINEKI